MYRIDNSDESYIKIIANKDILMGEDIGIWIMNYFNGGRYLKQEHMIITWYESVDLGRYCNHSNLPNTKTRIETIDDKISVILISNGIKQGEEIMVDYRIAEYITGYKVNLDFLIN
jgi:hypothetical protein